METSAVSKGHAVPSFSFVDRLKVEDFLKENNPTEAQKVIENFIFPDPIDDGSEQWIGKATMLIADLQDPVPQAVSELNANLLNDIKLKEWKTAENRLLKFSSSPRGRLNQDEGLDRWISKRMVLIEFLKDAVPSRAKRIDEVISEHIENYCGHEARQLLDQFKASVAEDNSEEISAWISRTGARIDRITGNAQGTSSIGGDALRSRTAPAENENPESGVYLNQLGTDLVDFDSKVLLRGVRYDEITREIYSGNGLYIGNASYQAARLYRAGEWMKAAKLPVIPNWGIARDLSQDLHEALTESGPGGRKREQNTYKENMAVLERLRADMQEASKDKFSIKKAGKIVWDNLNAGAVVDVVVSRSSVFGPTPGGIVNRGVDVLKNAFKREQMKMKESLESMHSALERETRPELQKLHPENKDAIAELDQKIKNEIKAVRTDATLETLLVKDILAMMEKRQFVLSIPKERAPINTNNETKRKILDECHEEHEAALLNVFNKYEANGGRQKQTESDAPNPNRVQVYLHGAPRTGKTHLAKRLGETYGDVYEVPPTYATPESLFRLPGDAMADSPHALPGGSSSYGRRNYPGDASPPMRARAKLHDSDYELSNEECFGKIPTKIIEEGCRVFFFDEGEKIFLGRDNDNPLVKYLFDPGRKILEGELDGIKVVFPWDHQLVIVTSNTALRNDALTGRFHAYLEFRGLSTKQQEIVYDASFRDAVGEDPNKAAIIEHCKNNNYRGMILEAYQQTEHPGADTIQGAVGNVAALIRRDFDTGVDADKIKAEIERSFRSPALVRRDELYSNDGRSLSPSPVRSVPRLRA